MDPQPMVWGKEILKTKTLNCRICVADVMFNVKLNMCNCPKYHGYYTNVTYKMYVYG